MLKVAFDPIYIHPLPENHRFPMEKYELLPKQLLHEGTLLDTNFFAPETIDLNTLLLVHDEDYVSRLMDLKIDIKEQKATGFVHSKQLIERERIIMDGTRQCAIFALEHGAAMNVAGGTHHAYSNRGEGFCLLNDQAIAAQYLLQTNLRKKIVIIDLDVHQGNGTAAIFQNNHSVFTFSMHGKNNYPLRKETSDLDVALDDGTDDATYLYQLEQSLDKILSRFEPDFIFYQSGVDVLSTDKLGRMAMTKNGCKQRDVVVVNAALQLGVPIVCTMGGGYSPEIKDIIEAHANTFRVIQDILF